MRSAKRRRNRALRRRSAGAHTALSCSPDRTLLYWNLTGIADCAVPKTPGVSVAVHPGTKRGDPLKK